jgi:precorrin-6B methylase 2
VRHEDAVALIRAAIAGGGTVWADLGAGSGTFTVALASLLGPDGTVYAVERDGSALRELESLERESARRKASAQVVAVRGDFTEPLALPPLDGVLIANALHYVGAGEQGPALKRLASLLGPTGRLVVIEYDRKQPNRWVPYPIARDRLETLAREAGVSAPEIVATAPSAYGPDLYCAVIKT